MYRRIGGLGMASLLAGGMLLTGCTGNATGGPSSTPTGSAPTVATPAPAPTSEGPAPSATAPAATAPAPAASDADTSLEALERRAGEAVRALMKRDLEAVAKLTHPERGVKFSPYGYIKPDTNRAYSVAQLTGMLTDKTVYNWGEYDGSGDQIDLDGAGYYAKFVADLDFANAPQTAVNQTIAKGNMINNIAKQFPAPAHGFVEYYFPGVDPKYEGMDWRSLRLVFEQTSAGWKLIYIVHDQWTV